MGNFKLSRYSFNTHYSRSSPFVTDTILKNAIRVATAMSELTILEFCVGGSKDTRNMIMFELMIIKQNICVGTYRNAADIPGLQLSG